MAAGISRVLIFMFLCCAFVGGLGWFQPDLADAETLTAAGNTAIATTPKNDTAAYVVMQRFQVTSGGAVADNKVELNSLTLDDNTATAQYSAVRVFISTSATTTLPGDAVQIGRTAGIWSGATATTIVLSSGTTTARTVSTGTPAYLYIVYDMLAGQAPNTAQSRVWL